MRNLRHAFAPLALLLAVSTLGLTGCGGGKSIAQPKPLTDLPAPTYRMQVVWHSNGGKGQGKYEDGFVPAVSGNRVYTANRDGEVAAFNLANGRRLWHTRLDATLASGPTTVDDRLLVGTRDGQVIAVSADDGAKQWQTDLSSEVIAPPAGADGIAVARTVDGHVAAMDLASGKRLWTIEGTVPNLTMRGTSTPKIRNQTVYIGMDSGKMLALDLQTGEQKWSQTVALPDGRSELDRIVDVDAAPLLDGDTIFAASTGDVVAALSRNTGQIRWKHAIASGLNMALDNGQLYVTGLDGVVWGVSAANGEPAWKNDSFQYRKVSAPTVLDGNVLVGDYKGYLHWLSRDDGHEIARGRPFGQAIRAQPVVVDGNQAIVLGADGELARVRFVPNGQ
ncbi:outer membrane protein assembly factor BamB [Salinisphaera sp. Q1T1-3]|uniref:outer membrane protein assembly factor BamB n=1 Tax=Salinisphaera sp. Q1T1-3 TaxID=2321229 RepID=UPI000E73BEEB|nr:outer membrane protein assembly factor BamB [Salinisphaera sp. Q1T1-3]RJS92322.1 outer membrane protein assembly factor BamB [Salinisphaera sp. Q1T1-3]